MRKRWRLLVAAVFISMTLVAPCFAGVVVAEETESTEIVEAATEDEISTQAEIATEDEITTEDDEITTENDIAAAEGEPAADNGIRLVGENISAEGQQALQDILSDHPVLALVYLSDEYVVRGEANADGSFIATVPSGQPVEIKNVTINENQEVWVEVSFAYQDQMYQGYVLRKNLACSDEMFLNWEQEYMTTTPQRVMRVFAAKAQSYADIDQFPDSYKDALTALKQAHPKWTFVKMNTNLDWKTVVAEELKEGRSLIESSFPAYMYDGLYSKGWAYATEDTLEYYLDPRNGLTENYIFQFELLTYNKTYHTEAAVKSFLNNTFMTGNAPQTSQNYANIFWNVGAGLNVSPFHLASRVFQEQGRGASPLISGTYSGYEGYYNFFNIGATGTTDKAVYESGLAKAKQEGWNNGYKSILGGAQVISANYILKGQDTLYLQKFDVDASYYGTYWHQYMQNICAPSSEATSTRKLYSNANSLDNTFVFKIPVYNNMPTKACAKPTEPAATVSYSISLKPPAGYADANIYLDGVCYSAEVKSGSYTVKAKNGKAKTAVMYQYNDAGVPTGMYVWTLSHNGSQYKATAVSELEDLLTYHGFSIRITGKAGIRFKTGISKSLRSKLTSTDGVAGYTLQEYGTLVMNNANREQYPLVKGGEKVLEGMSYGKNDKGVLEDNIYETVSGRYRYTSVLVGLPASQYQTDYAFRGYITLKKDGKEFTLYGPTVYKSIYSMAKQIISAEQYKKGTSADKFLRKLISDGDKAAN